MEIKLKYFSDDMIKMYKESKGDWIDLRCATDLFLMEGQYFEIPLGVAIELPEGYEAIVAPRSSTFKKYGLLMTNGIGVIDESYCGDNDEWHMPVYATRDISIPKGTRICQFRLFKHQPDFELVTVENLGNCDRGGLGSTGEI